MRGQVQGVGFRPFVWRLAQERDLAGDVINDGEGVLIRLWCGDPEAFARALRAGMPPLARIDAIEIAPEPGDPPAGFTIEASAAGPVQTRVTPDAATCPDCLAEIRNPGRRQGYAFTNCTHCGPRFSILRMLPYDRGHTTMAEFAMCPDCARDYGDPGDRRFHAQPIACPVCGPKLWFEGGEDGAKGDPIARAVDLLRAGGILAIRGIGGFHLACDAENAGAVALLRVRKHRPAKPFALMARERDLERIVIAGGAERAALNDPAAPVVVMAGRGALPEGIAPGIDQLGVMLPYTPLHHLLLDAFGGVLVMTSGNLSGEPQVIGNEEARVKLAGFADGFLMHDREIARRLDDSVVRAAPQMVLRHARGRVPDTIALPPGFAGAPEVLAMGGQMKGAICLLRDGQAMLSHHLGDLDEALCFDEFRRAIADYRALFDHHPALIALDPHPGYRAGGEGRAFGLPVTEVWHHHAHLAACLAENHWPRTAGRVAGIVLDGTGLGPDGRLWGGELLLGDYLGAERIAHLPPAPLAGGERAAREPWRNALVRLDQAGLGEEADRLFPDQPRAPLRAAVRAGMNAPLSSSAGRLFDAVAAILGICPGAQSYEGEAAMRLEALAGRTAAEIVLPDGLDPAPMLAVLIGALAEGGAEAVLARSFHRWLARGFARPARALIDSGKAEAVALSGGCFQNALLLRMAQQELHGVPVLTHRLVPANDGGLALGQALVAAAQHLAHAAPQEESR